ncbi:hypothetical protein [Lysobacter enzymogenes]|uniref:hypothetical protein n=1 Tax=Lysobacter enzymogenes TaxID=69 RepID=UPI0011138EBD|nr:hypothetical protein [Lysobacter enzymogenes]
MPPLPPPPVPQKLREMLGGYPEHIVRLQEVMNHLAATSSVGVGLFERAVWLLEGRLDTFISEARSEISAAQIDGDSERLARANAMRAVFGKARMQLPGLLPDLQEYLAVRDEYGRSR